MNELYVEYTGKKRTIFEPRDGDAGYDLATPSSFTLHRDETILVDIGAKIMLPREHVGFIKDRSGLASEHSIFTHAGVIDSSYRGPIKVLLMNHGFEAVVFCAGDRIAQLVIMPCYTGWARTLARLPADAYGRGEDGFGSTGK